MSAWAAPIMSAGSIRKFRSSSLQIGQRVLLQRSFRRGAGAGFDRNGPIVRIDELLSDGRIAHRPGVRAYPLVIIRSSLLSKEKLKPGLEVRLDVNQRVALEVIGMGKRIERSLETCHRNAVVFDRRTGRSGAGDSRHDRDAVPARGSFQDDSSTHVPKGFSALRPARLRQDACSARPPLTICASRSRTQTGVDHPEFFLHVKGPEILNMWVGESERQVRDLFSQCRERANDGALAFLFIDEAESILGTRRAGRFNSICSTLVPMFCTEMDGIDPLQNVVVILASNRADLIDPAILRPGRIDRKIKVHRPDEEGAQEDLRDLSARNAAAWPNQRDELAEAVTEAQFAHTPENQFLEVVYRSGKKDFLYRGDLASGAIIAAVVERAKGVWPSSAPSRRSRTPHLTREDLARGVAAGIRGERFVPADGHHGRLAEADRFRSGQRDQARPGATAQERRARQRRRVEQ